jgi:hypothetical protein
MPFDIMDLTILKAEQYRAVAADVPALFIYRMTFFTDAITKQFLHGRILENNGEIPVKDRDPVTYGSKYCIALWLIHDAIPLSHTCG